MIVDFSATWCKPCQKIAPIFNGLAKEYKGTAVFVKVDIDELPEAFDGRSIPSFQVRLNCLIMHVLYSTVCSGPVSTSVEGLLIARTARDTVRRGDRKYLGDFVRLRVR